MFANCTSLTTAPELPATTLATSCYAWMFGNCTGLTSAPEFPATTLAYGCYQYTLYGTNVLPDCSNIDLPADQFASFRSARPFALQFRRHLGTGWILDAQQPEKAEEDARSQSMAILHGRLPLHIGQAKRALQQRGTGSAGFDIGTQESAGRLRISSLGCHGCRRPRKAVLAVPDSARLSWSWFPLPSLGSIHAGLSTGASGRHDKTMEIPAMSTRPAAARSE